ncbi:tRNA (5-methylaminomethyl-2-thiouridine)(34)-methyltransferase MnmD [Deinococcus sp. KSM4-11]|uniref:tRNA (5-methylaminomethyl-2-thiouridine)(34)-methyltransferase MnmD n=1 Tax=Deinococcus sp. KSM4-11 TaxID=2568654 RepID=UPI001F11935C|nr:tRNA (5-methylaminomethyl-2-thiouridine)(34)-methyltransferase MnmD [Deinococcus sp. KSM4-11]
MPPDDPPIITTPDGSRTALSARYGEAYGSRHGAATQARHVFLEGTGTDTHPAPRVLEIGFGLGVNFRATLANTAARGAPLEYVAWEFDPAPVEILREVADQEAHPIWPALLERWAPDAEAESIQLDVQDVRLTIHFEDVLTATLPRAWATALYLDGFSPTRNPEVWTPDFVARLALALAPGGMLATYSAAGHVRRALQAAGLRVERRPGAPGKRECLRAVRFA